MTVTENIPDKSRCLRQSSVAKRLETEKQRRQPRVKERTSKKYMSKYRRKTENAKERERMKKFNEAFELYSQGRGHCGQIHPMGTAMRASAGQQRIYNLQLSCKNEIFIG